MTNKILLNKIQSIIIILMKHIEYNVFKQGIIHDTFQKCKAIRISNKKLIFLHIPRTCGDSTRTCFFNCLNYDDNVNNIVWKTKKLPYVGDVSKLILDKGISVKGFFSFNELTKIENNCLIFTFIRNPIDRVLSIYYLRYKYKNNKLENFINTDLNDFINSNDKFIISLTQNSMTWQLGDQLDIEKRTLTINQAYKNAKKMIKKICFIGDFNRLYETYILLKKLLLPHVKTSNYILQSLSILGSYLYVKNNNFIKLIGNENYIKLCEKNSYDIKLYKFIIKQKNYMNII